MWIKSLSITNFRLFGAEKPFELDNLNIPDGEIGSGITVFVGENGCGKTSLLDAISLPILTYKTEGININDFNDPKQGIEITILSDENYGFKGTMPNANYTGKGFQFISWVRLRANKSYLSSTVVSDQKFIKADGEEKPKDNTPDLRLSVNNPFVGNRFDENDIIFLDKNRTYQIRSGTYNKTRFDRLMEDFNYQYIQSSGVEPENHNEYLDDKLKKGKIEHQFLASATQKFEELSGFKLSLDIVDNWKPFETGFFAERKENDIQVRLGNQGSGYEMLFTLVYSYEISKQSGKQLIILIDEPELHLHPKLQEKFVEYLFSISSESQIFLTSHSPLLVKQLLKNKKVNASILKKDEPELSSLSSESLSLPYVSANEVNYVAFDLATPELHNELYGHLQEKTEKYTTREFDDFLKQNYNLQENKSWIELRNGSHGKTYPCTLQTYVRHSIHHPENELNDDYTELELETSCKELMKVLKSLTCPK